MFPFVKKSPWCTVLRLLLSLQPLLPPQVYPTRQQRQPIRFAPLYSFLSLILQHWISALSFNRDWLHHRSTALLSLLKASSTHRASVELDSISPCFLMSAYTPFYTNFSALLFHAASLYFLILYLFITYGTEMFSEVRNIYFSDSFLTLFMHMFIHERLYSLLDCCIDFNICSTFMVSYVHKYDASDAHWLDPCHRWIRCHFWEKF